VYSILALLHPALPFRERDRPRAPEWEKLV